MNIEYDIFNHLKATSLEPYDNDDYVDSITYGEQKQIWNRLKEKDKEIERLNNIINELKEYSKKRIDELKLQEGNWGLKMVSELNEVYTFYGKIINLQELKGSDKDENN